MSHLDEHKLLSDRQNAFRKSHSCETQLATVIDVWAKILDNQGQVDTFVLDFEKNVLTLLRMNSLKANCSLMESEGRQLNGLMLSSATGNKELWLLALNQTGLLLYLVPQRTVLGPLLFSLHINDIISNVESEIRLIVDDCVCCREIKNVEDTVKLQKDIYRLRSWARKLGIRFQPVKCNIMQLTNKWTSKIQVSYNLEGTVLENVESSKYLGVTITEDLKWNTHISNVCTNANFLRRNLFSCPQLQDVREAAYKCLVRPILEYGSSVWGPHYEGLIVRKRAVRFVTI